MRLREKLLTALLLLPLVGTSAVAKERGNFDAFLARQGARSLNTENTALQSRGARVEHMEDRLGVPTVLFSERRGAGTSSVHASMKPEQAARAHLQQYTDVYRLSVEDISSAPLHSIHDTGFGPVIARFEQKVEGIEVFRSTLNVVMDRKHELVAITGYLTPRDTIAARVPSASTDFRLDAADAIAKAFTDLTDTAISARSLASAGTKGVYTHFTFEQGVSGVMPHAMATPARAKKVYFTLPDGLQPAWYVELNVGTKSSKDSDYFSYVISATDGSLLFRNDLTAEDAFSYRVWANPTDFIPFDGPHGNDATPHPTGNADGYQEPLDNPAGLITLQNFPYSQNDPWLPAGATQTTGNNAEAYADLGFPDGFQPDRDLRAEATSPGAFDYTYDVTKRPSLSANQRKAAIVNLFYINNFLHDFYYDAGFDEQAGNAQASNYGRGGLEGDSLKIEAQDYSGRNNANMSTPSDGARPRMQMYVFDGVNIMRTLSPASLAGPFDVGTADFGSNDFNLTGDLLILNPTGTTLGCTAFPPGTFTGKIAVIDRGSCPFATKALIAQNAGASAVIIANNAAGLLNMTGVDPAITVPVVSVTLAQANAWKTAAAGGATISVRLNRSPDLDRDGTLDNAIVAHEWGHYISNRLVGNSNGLSNNQGRGMGEGWADFHALLMMVRDEDRTKPGNNTFQGVYAVAGYVESGGENNGHYFGIRRIPYSTNLAKNALMYRHIANGNPLPTTHPVSYGQAGRGNAQVHATGEVWATMLWECYASLLNAYPFAEAQNRMKQYLLAAYKITPNAPTVLEARDALLAVTLATDIPDHVRFLNAFAKRGAGSGAKAADRNAGDNVGVTESSEAGTHLEVVSITLDDRAGRCDGDDVLDKGETGFLTVTLRNSGRWYLAPFTGTVTASGASATMEFPGGNTLSFPEMYAGDVIKRSLRVKLNDVSGATPRAGLSIAFDEPSLPVALRTALYNDRVHYDEAVKSSSVEDFESSTNPWVSTRVGSGFGWQRVTEKNTDGTFKSYLHGVDLPVLSEVVVTSPWMRVRPTGNFIVNFKYRHSLESDLGTTPVPPWWDGAVMEISIDGVVWYDVFDLGVNPGYGGYIEIGDNPLSDRAAYVGTNLGFPNWSTANVNLSTILADLDVKVRFRIGTDSAVGAYGFDIDDIQVSNVTAPPFTAIVPETSDGTTCNRRPNAVVSPNAVVTNEFTDPANPTTRTQVVLNGSGSSDPDLQPLTYQWTQINGFPVTLNDATTATPWFEADVAWDETLTFQLVVNDGVENSLPRNVDVTIINNNRKPVAVAAGPASVDERSGPSVTLNGGDSGDSDFELISYSWSQVEDGAPRVTLLGKDSATPSFALPEVPANTLFTFQLVVNDGLEDSDPATVSVMVNNVDRAPNANAGADQTVNGRAMISLAGTATDPDGEAITYAWTQVSGTPTVTLTGANTATPSFMSPDVKAPAVLMFRLDATANGQTASDTVAITVRADQAPTVNAGVNQAVNGRTLVSLFGAASDADGDAVTYAWTQLPGGPAVTLTGANTATPTFTSPDVKSDTTLTFQLTVTANGLNAMDTVDIMVRADGAPVANAGADQTVDGRATVTLSGFASDPDGDTLTYAWTQLPGGPTVTLTGANTANPTFTSPDVKSAAVLRFQLTVTSNGLSAMDTVSVTVRADRAPSASAGENRMVDGRTSVTLSGSASDPESDAITYAWTQVEGPSVTLAGTTTATPSFTSPDVKAETVLRFQLIASANGLTSSPSTVTITVRADRGPSASAGENRTVDGRTLVTLSGSASDPESDTLTYAWTQVEGPSVTLTGATTATPSFTSPDVKSVAVLRFQLIATANGLASSPSTVTITVRADRSPTVNAGMDQVTEGNSPVSLFGSASDPEDDTISYAWTVVEAPPGVSVTLTGATTATPTFTAPDVAMDSVVRFQLTVTANGLTASDIVAVTIRPDRLPLVNAGADQMVDGRTLVSLSGSASDPDGGAITYAWTVVATPPGVSISLSNANTATPSFTSPDVKSEAVLVFRLTITAGGKTATDTVAITVRADRAPTAQAGADQDVNARASVMLQGAGSDPEGDAVTYAWSQVSGTSVTLTGATTATPTFTAPDVRSTTTLVFQLTVTANGLSTTDEVSITVRKVNRRPVGQGPATFDEVEGTAITLDASRSSDPDGDTLTYSWTQTGGPPVTMTGQNTAMLQFTAPEVSTNTLVSFVLVVSDADGFESEPTAVFVRVLNVNKAPVPQPRKLAGEVSAETVTLDAATSRDPDGEVLTYKWEQTEGPTVTLSSTTEPTVTFTAPDVQADTKLVFKVTVTDPSGATASQTVEMMVKPKPAVPQQPVNPDEGGCASTGSSSGGVMLLALLAGVLLSRRRGFLRG
jgi:hypothetical protein